MFDMFIVDIAVTHNCIIATVQLFHPGGQEAKNRLTVNISCTVTNIVFCLFSCCSWTVLTTFISVKIYHDFLCDNEAVVL